MKLKVTLTVLFLANIIFVFAQESSGYLGKRTLLGVTTTLSPALGNLINSSDFSEFDNRKDFLLPPLRIGFYAAYANKDYSMWQLSISYQKIEVMRNAKFGYSSSTNNNIIKSLTSKAIFITGGRTWYLGGTTAPLGKYFTYNLLMAFVDAEKVGSTNNTTKLGRRFDAGFNIILGTRRAITDRILIDLGMEYNILFVGLFSYDYNEYSDPSALPNVALSRNFLNNLFGLRTGVYYLL